jgi:glycopeptide antibiotics resistance protein
MWQDISAVPLTLFIVFAVRRLRGISEPIPGSHIIGTAIAFTVVFEILLPLLSSRFVADVWDLWCYTIGGVIFYMSRKIISTRTR